MLTKNCWTHTTNFKKSNQTIIHHTTIKIMVKTNPNTTRTMLTSGCDGRQGSEFLEVMSPSTPRGGVRWIITSGTQWEVVCYHFRIRNRERKWIWLKDTLNAQVFSSGRSVPHPFLTMSVETTGKEDVSTTPL